MSSLIVPLLAVGSTVQIYRNNYISKFSANVIMMLASIITIIYYAYILSNQSYHNPGDSIAIFIISSTLILISTLFYFDMLYPEWWPYLHF